MTIKRWFTLSAALVLALSILAVAGRAQTIRSVEINPNSPYATALWLSVGGEVVGFSSVGEPGVQTVQAFYTDTGIVSTDPKDARWLLVLLKGVQAPRLSGWSIKRYGCFDWTKDSVLGDAGTNGETVTVCGYVYVPK